MTVGAQNSQVSLVGLPVFVAARPSVLAAFGADLRARVNVVNVQRPNVRKAAAYALASEAGEQLQFLAPIVRVLCCAVSVPPSLLALRCAELSAAFSAALATIPGAAPSRRKITRLAAIFARPVFDSVSVHQGGRAAMLTGNFDFWASHAASLSKFVCFASPGYFDIACRRIEEAWKQPRLFSEPKAKPQPAPGLFDGDAA